MSNQYDRIEKEDSNYLGAWVYWTLQKDSELGIMRIYKNGELFLEGFNKTRPMGGPVDSFRLGSGRLGGAWWNGWVDEFRIGLFIESAEEVLASYNSQRPNPPTTFFSASAVEGPPVILPDQVGEGYANDSARPLSYFIKVFPSASNFSAVGLPAGVTLNATTGELTGEPLQGGTYKITVTASNAFGSSQEIINLRVSEVSGFTHFLELSLSGYAGSEILTDFPMLVRMDSTLDANFSLNSFSSSECNDLRFYDDEGRDLPYEIESIDFDNNSLIAWVRVAELANDKSVFAYWGNPSLASTSPVSSTDGSTWNAGYRGVWHLRSMSETDVLTDSSFYRNHATNVRGITAPQGKFGAGRLLQGGGDHYIKIPRSYSLNSLGKETYSYSMWANLENQPDTKAMDSFYAVGFEQSPNDSYFNNINNLLALKPSGSRIYKSGPRQGLYLSGDADFRNANIGINRNDNYMTLFLSMFHPPEDGNYRFRCTDKDDRATIWLDLDRDGEFEINGDDGTEFMGGINNFTSDWVPLSKSGGPYKIAVAHGERGAGSRLRPWIMVPGDDTWHIIDPSDPAQAGFWQVPFDSSITDQLSAFTFFKHGGVSSLDLKLGKFGMSHPLSSGILNYTSSVSLSNNRWYHLHKQIDAANGQAQLFVDGNLEVSESFDPALGIENAIESEWIVGSGTITSTIDEIRISDRIRSNDWVSAVYQNQKAAPSFPTTPNALTGPPSFTSAKEFVISAEKPFTHVVSATGVPSAFVGTGLPSGLLLNPADGNLSGVPSTAGVYTPTLRAVYADGTQAYQNYNIEVLAGPPDVELSTPQSGGASSLQVPFEVLATGGDEPIVFILVDTMDQGTDFYKWKYRFDTGKQALGTNSILVGGLAPDQSYYVRLYAYNSVGEDWTGKIFSVRTQPNRSSLPFGLAMWLDATQISGPLEETNATLTEGMQISTWVDLSGNDRHMNIEEGGGDPTIAMDGYEGKAVVDFDGNDQLVSTYNFAGNDLQLWRNGGYTAFGISRYTGGRSNRVISSRGQNWIMGHHGNRNARFYFNGWVHGGTAADTKFHIWEIKQEGRSQMAIHTAPSMRMELSWPIIKIRIIGGTTRGRFHLVAGVIYRKHPTVR